MSITAIVENDSIKLPMHVPDGTQVEVTLSTENKEAAAEGWPLFGLLKGKMTMAPDFDEPLEEFLPYME